MNWCRIGIRNIETRQSYDVRMAEFSIDGLIMDGDMMRLGHIVQSHPALIVEAPKRGSAVLVVDRVENGKIYGSIFTAGDNKTQLIGDDDGIDLVEFLENRL